MPIIKTYKCDVCGAEKKETNHWFQLVNKPAFRLESLVNPNRNAVIVCGQECAHRALDQWLGSQKGASVNVDSGTV
jgi:hypothetical protein